MARNPASWLLMPYHTAALATGAKSFRDNPLIGSERLNRLGLHVSRMRIAAQMADRRRRRLADLVDEADAHDFARDGYVIREDFLPKAIFEPLKRELARLKAPARDMLQGDAVTRRIALERSTLRHLPATRALAEDPRWLGLIRYVGASDLEPLLYVQTIFSRVKPDAIDPQTLLHADTFHSTVKAWFFVDDVTLDDGPFVYVPGSHRLTPRRLAWERQHSIRAAGNGVFQASRGSPRISLETLARLGLGQPKHFAVKANTLVGRRHDGFPCARSQHTAEHAYRNWAYGRRNPFLPWIGLDPLGMPPLRGRVVPLTWRALDLRERLGFGRSSVARCGHRRARNAT